MEMHEQVFQHMTKNDRVFQENYKLNKSSNDDFCSKYVKYNSNSLLLNLKNPSNLLFYDLPRIHLQLAIIFIFTHFLHYFLFTRSPRVISEIMAGVLLGPSLMASIDGFAEKWFPVSGDLFLDYLSRMGFIFFIFSWGVKMDPKMILKTGRRGWIIGVTGAMLPAISGVLLLKLFKKVIYIEKWNIITYVISLHCSVQFPMVASALVHLKIINTELGQLALSSGLIINLMEILLKVIVYTIRVAGWFNKLQYIGAYAVLLLVIVMIVRPLSHWIIKQTPGTKPVKSSFVIIMWILVLLTVILADNIGIPHEIAAFLLGLIGIPDGPPLGSSLVKQLETLVDGLLAPMMVSYCGSQVGNGNIYDLDYMVVLWFLVGCCLVIKVVSLLLPALVVKVPPRDTITLAFVLSSQGIVQISSHLFLLTVEVYDAQDFSVMVFSVLVIAAVTNNLARTIPYDYSFSYIGYNKRTIQHEGVDGELTILQCIYHLDDVFPTRKLLEVSMPDENSPLSVSVMHLGELVGRASPQLIDHKFSQKEILSSSIPHSQELLEYFVNFEHKNTGLAHIQFFSAISMFKFMHQDICSLAFKQSVSLIILPFHRKWNHQGKVISDNNNLRAVNINVLQMLPCSVGILVDHQKVHHSLNTTSSSYDVGVIFIGGPDDIEALSYGKRMARSPRVHLTVVQILAETTAFANEWDDILDTEALWELNVSGKDNIVYRQEAVKHGAETALIIHELQESCDIVLVGRRHKEKLPQLYGLTEWNEFPELGPLGDVTAISEIKKPHSVLVVQQHAIKQK